MVVAPRVLVQLAGASAGSSDLPHWVQWVSALAPFFTLVAALIAGTIAVLGLRQRSVADAKEEWWTRFAWASDLLLDARPDRQEIGVRTLTLLAGSDLAQPEELEVIDAAWGGLLDAHRDAHRDTPLDTPLDTHLDPQRLVPAATRVQVLAARGRQVVDARLHRATEPWVAEIAGNTAVTRP